MKSEEKKWRPNAGMFSYQNHSNSAFLLLYSSIPILPFLTYPTILCKFFHTRQKISRSADHRCIFIFISILWVFVCIKGYPSSDSGPSIENFLKRVQSRRWKGAKGKIAYASCVRVVFISRIFIHTVRKRQFEKQDWTEAGATKWRAFF